MNKYLKSAAERYNQTFKGIVKIHPISEIDGEIITEMYEAVKKLGAPQDLITIFQKYKFNSDEQTRDDLLDFNVNYQGKRSSLMDDDDEYDDDVYQKNSKNKKYSTEFVLIDGKRFMLRFIFGYEPIDDEIKNEFKIKINPTPPEATKLPLYSNQILTYYDEDRRDEVLSMIDELIRLQGGKVLSIDEFFE